MADKAQSIETRILKWLSEHGYPLEMRIARSLAQKGYDVTQSHYFTDYETEKPREIDVLGRLYSFIEPKEYVAIAELETFVAVECKSSPKPWIVFCETKPHQWNIRQAACNSGGETLLARAGKAVRKTELYSRALGAGHGVAQAFGGKSDLAYSALMSALKAAEAMAREYREIEVRLSKDKEMSHVCESAAAIPVVAITAPLFECRLSGSGEPELKSVSNSSIVFRYPSGGGRLKKGTVVHLITESGWEEFQDALIEFHKALETKLSTLIPEAVNSA